MATRISEKARWTRDSLSDGPSTGVTAGRAGTRTFCSTGAAAGPTPPKTDDRVCAGAGLVAESGTYVKFTQAGADMSSVLAGAGE